MWSHFQRGKWKRGIKLSLERMIRDGGQSIPSCQIHLVQIVAGNGMEPLSILPEDDAEQEIMGPRALTNGTFTDFMKRGAMDVNGSLFVPLLTRNQLPSYLSGQHCQPTSFLWPFGLRSKRPFKQAISMFHWELAARGPLPDLAKDLQPSLQELAPALAS